MKNALKIENWCKINYGEKEMWDRKLPSSIAKNEEEKGLGNALLYLKIRILEKYEGKVLEEIEDEEDKKIVEIIRRLDEEYGLSVNLKNALKIENWCKINYGEREIWDRKLPSSIAKNEEEKRLGKVLINLRQRFKKYEGKELEKIDDDDDRRIIEILRRLDEEYGLSGSLKNALEIENWCKTNYGNCEIWNRKLPSKGSKDNEEKD